jgi:tetratricopeptide (TPR) repeat protein
MVTQSPVNADQPEEQRADFIGRVQEQRQFRVALSGLVAHQRRWRDLAYMQAANFDPEQAPGDDSYAHIFLPHGIGGIGKSWLARRCLTLAEEMGGDPPILTLYDDVSLGSPVLEPVHLLDRLADHLARADYDTEVAAYRQAQADLPGVVERVTRYQAESRERWADLLHTARGLLVQEDRVHRQLPNLPSVPRPPAPDDAAIAAQAYDLLTEQMQQEGKITRAEAMLFRHPALALAARLVVALKRVARRRPVVIALDNLEVIVPLEPFLRDHLVLPTTNTPLIWILSGRYNLADERLVEVNGVKQDYKGYRDLLGENPPVVWDMSIFSDADLREYLEAEAERRQIALEIDESLIDAVKSTSSGVPLVVEMVADALFSMERTDFLREFVLDDKTLLPAGRLEQITTRFLRYCLNSEDDLERVQGLALLHKGADEAVLHAVWNLLPGQSARELLNDLRLRYAFVLSDGLHDAVYDFVRRELRTLKHYRQVRDRLSKRAVSHYQAEWSRREAEVSDDPLLRVRDPRWQRTVRDLLNALLWYDPDEAIQFLLPRFVEGLGFDRPFAEGLLIQTEEFLGDAALPLSRSAAKLVHQLRTGLKDIGLFDEPGEAVGRMVDKLLQTAELEPLHLSILHRWQGDWLVQEGRYPEALKAYLAAEANLPPAAANLRRQLGQGFYQLSSIFLWPESALETVPSEPGLQAAQHAVALDPDNGDAWFNLGAALDYLEREAEAVPAYQRAIELEPRPLAYNGLGDVYTALGRYDEAIAAYQQAIELNPAYPWPYHNLGLLYEHRGDYDAAVPLYRQALERHQRDKDKAVTWDNLGNVYAAQGESDEAIAAYRWASVLNPGYAPPWHGLGDVYSALGRADEASKAYRQAIALDPDKAWPYNNLALVYEQRGEYQQAITLYQEALERHQDDGGRAVSWRNLGDVYHALSRTDEAIAAYQRASQLNPEDAHPPHSLGDLYSSLGRSDEAITAYHQAVSLDPDYAPAYNGLGNVYGQLGRHDDAITAYRRVIELSPDNPGPYNNLGFIYAERGEFEAAITAYRQALERQQRDKDKAVSWNNLGGVYEAVGNDSDAVTAYQTANGLDPAYAWPYHNLGLIYKRQANYEAALTAFRQAIDRHADNEAKAQAHNELGDVYLALERRSEALDAYRRATELDPTFALPWNSLGNLYRVDKRPADAEQAYRRAIELDPDLAWPYHSLALLEAQRGNYLQAVPLYQQALARHRRDADRAVSWHHLGEVYAVLERFGEAEQAYQQAVALDPAYAWPYHHLGLLYEQRGELPEALVAFRQALARHQQDEDRAVAWNHLGNVNRRLDRIEEAVEAYQRANTLDSAYAQPWSNLGDIYRELGRQEEAMAAYRQAIGLDPVVAWPYHHLGWLHQQRGEYEPAITRYEQAVERHQTDPARAMTWQQLGQIYQAIDRPQEAIKAFRQAGALDPKFALPWHHLGDTYRALNRREQALNAYQRASELDPAYAPTWSNLGDLYDATNRRDEAIKAYRRAIELDPANAWDYHHLGAIFEARGDYPAALNYYQQAAARHPVDHDRALAWNSLGDVYRALKQPEQAIDAYRRASGFDPAYPWPYHRLGQLYEQRGETEQALAAYQQAITHHGGDRERAELWERVGHLYQEMGRYEQALAAYRSMTRLDPQNAAPWNNLGAIHRMLNRPEDAIAAYRRSIKLAPKQAWPYHRLAEIYAECGEYEAALAQFQEAIARHRHDPDRAAAWQQVGHIYTTLKQPEQALDAYRQATQIDPQAASPWNSLGDVYQDLNRPDEAIKAYQQAIQLDSTLAWPYHHLGEIYQEREEYQQAVTSYRQAIERHPANQNRALAWYGLGNVYDELSELRAATEAYQQAIKADPAYAWPYQRLGLIYERQGEYEAAEKLYRQALERHQPDEVGRAVTWHHLGNTRLAQNNLEAALEAYQQAGAIDATYALPWNSLGDIYTALGRNDEAIAAYQRAAKLDEAYVLPWSGLGTVYAKLSRYPEAVSAFEHALTLDPEAVWLYQNLGLVHERQNNYEAALRYYQQAIQHQAVTRAGQPQTNRDQAVLYYCLGNVYRALSRYVEAIDAFQQAIQLDGQFALPWNGLGGVYSAQGQPGEAIKAYERAIEVDPAYAWPYHNLGLIYESLEKYEQALAFYEQAIVRHTSDREQAVSWHNLGNLYNTLGHYEQAIVIYRRAIELDPASALPWNSLGDIYDDLKQPDQAITAYRRAIELAPDYAWPYNNLGVVYEKLGEYEQAMALYRQVIERHPSQMDRAVSWTNLGNIYSALNQPEQAINAYEQAIELDPGYTWPYHNLGAIYEQRGERDLALAMYEQAIRQRRREPVQLQLK